MNIKIWGSRGSHPTPLSSKAIELKIKRVLELAASEDISSPKAVDDFVKKLPFSMKHTYGGNTTCIELTVGGRHIIIDCGSGLVNLGKHLMNGPFGEGKGTADIFITHTHWDHIQGIPFFVPIYIAGNSFNFYSPVPNLHKRLVHQQAATHFPILFDGMASTKQFFKIALNKVFLLDEVRVIPKKMPHPGKSYAYRIEYGGKTFVYTGDCEFNIGELDKINSYRSIFDKADVLLFDAQYTFADSINKFEWGHSSAFTALDIASMFNVKHLLLFHHEPSYSDEKLDEVLANAISYRNMHERFKDITVELAYEGLEFEL